MVAELMHKPITLDEAARSRAADSVSGKIVIEFDADSDGNVRRRSRVITIETKKSGGQSETETITETLERHSTGVAI